MARFAFAMNMRNMDKSKLICADESSMQTYQYSIYHNRLISSKPSANCTYIRSVDTINIWAGLSLFGCTPCVVQFFIFFYEDLFKKFYRKTLNCIRYRVK